MMLKDALAWLGKDGSSRDIMKAGLSFLCNLLYASFNLALAWIYQSEWYLMMAAFLSPFCIMRFLFLQTCRRGSGDDGLGVLHAAGIIMLFLDAMMVAIVYVTSRIQITEGHGEIVMITIAAYTFTKLGLAVFKAVNARKDGRLLSKAMRCISYAELTASMLSLQRSMIVSFGSGDHEWACMMNIISGSAACLLIAAIGISMISCRRGRGEIKSRRSGR